MRIVCPAFADGTPMDTRFTQEGSDLSPELVFEDVPTGAQSLVLLSDDPDAPDPKAPKLIWLHWLVVNLPPDCRGLAEGEKSLPAGAAAAVNDSGCRGWSGPLPPIGVHRYYFKLYALDCRLDLPEDFTRAQAEQAIQGHILAQAQTMGTYICLKNRS